MTGLPEKRTGSGGIRASRGGDRLTSWLLLAGIVGSGAFVASVVATSLVTPGYDDVGEAISQLAARGRPHAAIAECGMAAFGVLTMAFACGLRRRLPAGRWSVCACASLALFGLAAFGCAAFREMIETVPVHDWQGTAHMLSGRVAAVGLVVGAFAVSRAVAPRTGWRWVSLGSMAVSGIGVVAGLVFTLSLAVAVTGLVQKGFLAVYVLWMSWIAERALRSVPGVRRVDRGALRRRVSAGRRVRPRVARWMPVGENV